MENIALRIWQILYTFVLQVENNTQLIPLGIHFSRTREKFANLARLYFLQFTTFAKFRMLFQAVVNFSDFGFFKISSKMLKVHCA